MAGARSLVSLRLRRGRGRACPTFRQFFLLSPLVHCTKAMAATRAPGGGNKMKALELLRTLPRVTLANLRPNPDTRRKEKRRGRGRHNPTKRTDGQKKSGSLPRLGFEGGQTPFYLVIPKYGYNEGHHLRRQYPPLSLRKLQYLIDLGRIDPMQPVDLTQLTNARGIAIQPLKRHYGVHLVEEGADIFAAKVNIEVQWVSELAIAAVEKNGGVITTAFYDPRSLEVLCKPVPFFQRGKPIPKRLLPPEDLVHYYTDPTNRGYLADPSKVAEARMELSKKYGYILPDVTKDELFQMLSTRKDPRQIFFGLAPGWIVNMSEKKILKPTDERLLKYYSS